MKTYRIADSLRKWDIANAAVATGEFRAPRKDEWYLSGAIVAAYRAPNDLSTKFHIAKLVRNHAN